ncbi:MAG: tRNA 2-thiocytidine biosynthesis TtcA family protein [Clostridiales bacterium]|jgi:tRNA(Ile)-lysidine synthase TilS/MesJ|nr:tRNA 2-thiocytidine biosynthesis TtcA family protein [Clostridiales bacterium]
MNLQQILSHVRRACEDYRMIPPGEKIAVAVSGGKDSLTLLAALAAMRRFYPNAYTLEAITVDLGFSEFDTAGIEAYCAEISVPYTVLRTDIGRVIFEERREPNPCSLCAKMRKGALNAEALRRGVTRIAYGHNRDDIIHTFFMSLFYEGRLHAPEPVTFLDRTGLYAIRPLIYVPEKDVIGFTKRAGLPVVKSPCPADGNTRREEMRRFTAEMRGKYQSFDAKMFTAVSKLYIANQL